MKKWEPLHLTLDSSKSDKGQGDYQNQITNVEDKEMKYLQSLYGVQAQPSKDLA